LGERHQILMTMLDAVYVDTVEEKAIVALKPKPEFQSLFQIATTKEGSGVVLYNEGASGLSTMADIISVSVYFGPLAYLTHRGTVAIGLVVAGLDPSPNDIHHLL
jgi:hypothetical protein